eukprot:COSAG01_NODE_23565_length_810_cov_2.049226_1_plen_180_part_10
MNMTTPPPPASPFYARPELRQAALVLIILLGAATAAKQLAAGKKATLTKLRPDERLQQQLWGWDSLPDNIQRARRCVLWSSYFRLAMAAAAVITGSVAVIMTAGGLAASTALLVPLLSFAGSVAWQAAIPGDGGSGGAVAAGRLPRLSARLRACVRHRGRPSPEGPLATVVLTGFLGAGK